jgi:molecular chaperone GrpE
MTETHASSSSSATSDAAESFSAEVESTIAEVFAKKEAELKLAKEAVEAESAAATQDAQAEEIATLKDQLIRSVAEMENLRKRHERDMQDARKYAVTGFARDMVGVMENLQLALLNIPEEARKADEKLGTLAEGVEMTANELTRIFQNHGIVRITPLGEKFNHNFHQAVAQVEDASKEAGTITQVLQAGYIIHDRLLRPAMVTVAKAAGGVKVDTQA